MRACRISIPVPARPVRAKSPRRPDPTGPEDKLGQRDTSVVSYFPTRKGEPRMERLRHYAHRALAVLLETDPQVLTWTTEAEPLPLGDGERACEFVPNFWVVERRRRVAIRVLRADRLRGSRQQERHAAVRDAYDKRGVCFEVRTEEAIAADPRLPAARYLLWHRAWDVPDEVAVRVGAMAADPPRTLGQLHARLGGAAETWPQVLSMVARGGIEICDTVEVGPGTEVVACRMRGHG